MDNLEVEYLDISSTRKSEIWKHFLMNKNEQKAKCKICNFVIKSYGRSTGVFINHLKCKHGIILKNCMSDVAGMGEDNPKHPRVDFSATSSSSRFVKKGTLGETIAHLVSVDNFSYNQIATSTIFKRALRNEGYDMPDSPDTVREIFLKEYRRTLIIVKKEIAEEKMFNVENTKFQ